MTTDNPLPRRLILLGENFQGMLERLDRRIAEPVTNSHELMNEILEPVSENLTCFATTISHFSAAINSLMPDVIENETASDANVYRAATKVEIALDTLLNQYHQVSSWYVVGEDKIPQRLLVEAFRYTLVEARFWLSDIAAVLSDPIAELQKRGLPTEGYVELPLQYTITPPPQIGELQQWVEQQGYRINQVPPNNPKPNCPGLGLLGWLGLFWLGSELFDDDD